MTAWAIAHQMAKAKELSYWVAGGIFNGADRCSESLHLGAGPAEPIDAEIVKPAEPEKITGARRQACRCESQRFR